MTASYRYAYLDLRTLGTSHADYRDLSPPRRCGQESSGSPPSAETFVISAAAKRARWRKVEDQ